MPIFIEKMRIFSNLRENFSSLQDLHYFKHYLSSNSISELDKALAEAPSNILINNGFVSNKYELKFYEEITAIVTSIRFSLVNRLDLLAQNFVPTIKHIKAKIIEFIEKGMETFKNMDFEYT